MFKYLKQLTSLVAMVAVLFTFSTESMAIDSVEKVNNTATIATKEVNCFKYLNIILPFSYFYLLTNNSKLLLNILNLSM